MSPKRTNRGTAVERVADKFGGFVPLADICGVTRIAVCLWNTRKTTNRRGRDGNIPDRYHGLILAAAKKRKVRVRPGDLVNV